LVCLGFCGGGTGSYRSWLRSIGEDTELALICYPGREGRFGEEFAVTWDQLAEDVTGAVARASNRPYSLFGHSMGGWMAFDVATRLADRGGPLPVQLIVSSCNAANRGLTDRDRFPRNDEADGSLLDWMSRIGLLPDYVLESSELREMSVELMRADIRVRDSYLAPLDSRSVVPLQVLYGRDDPVIEPKVAEQWARCAGAGIRVDALPGGHFYNRAIWESLPEHFVAVGDIPARKGNE
jgi:surfactin synthase thioesterase subunit